MAPGRPKYANIATEMKPNKTVDRAWLANDVCNHWPTYAPAGAIHEHLLETPPLEAHRVFFLSTLERIHSQIGNDGCSQWRIGGARSFDNSREWFLQNP